MNQKVLIAIIAVIVVVAVAGVAVVSIGGGNNSSDNGTLTITESGEYSGTYSHVVIDPQVGDGTVTLNDVVIKGNLDVNGGGSHSVILNNCTIEGDTVVAKEGGETPRIVADGTDISNLVLKCDLILETSGGASVSGIISEGNDITVQGDATKVDSISMDGGSITVAAGSSVGALSVSGDVSLDLADGTIPMVTITGETSITGDVSVPLVTMGSTAPVVKVNGAEVHVHIYVADVAVAPTCTTDGSTEGAHCPSCDYVFKTQETLPATGHSYGAPSYNWADDNSSCEASRTCSVCGESNLYAAPSVSMVTDATCTTDGYTVYTAAFSGVPYETQSKQADIVPALGHNWSFTLSFIDGRPVVNAACARDPSHDTVIESAQGAVKEGTGPTCTESGKQTWVLYFGLDGQVYEGLELESDLLPATGHDWDVEFAWSDDHATATYKGVCKNNNAHVCSGNADVEDKSTLPTCTEPGIVGKTASAVIDGKTYTKVYGDITPANGHTWGKPTYAWSEADGGYACTATHTCSVCSVTESEDGKVTEKSLVAALCETTGKTLYTAVFMDFDPVTKDVETPALGHDWSAVVAKEATCTELGWGAYQVCKLCGKADGYSAIPALGHDLKTVAAKAATVTEKGWYEYNACTRCDYNDKVEYGPLDSFTVTVYGGTAEADGIDAASTIKVVSGTVVTVKATTYETKTFSHWSNHVGDLSPGENNADHDLFILVNQDTYITARYTEDLTYDLDNAKCIKESGCTVGALYRIAANEDPNYFVYYTAEASNHTYPDDPEVLVEPTCTESGIACYRCVVCGYEDKYVLSPEGHTFSDDPDIPTEANGSVIGVKVYTCSVCGATEKKQYISAVIPDGDQKVVVKVYDTYYGDAGTATKDEIHYTFKITDSDGVVRQAYLYFVDLPVYTHYEATVETWVLWIDYGDHSPIYICHDYYSRLYWQYEYTAGDTTCRWGIVGYADSIEDFYHHIDILGIGGDSGARSTVLDGIYYEWQDQFNTYGPDHFKKVNAISCCGKPCTVYWDIYDQYEYIVDENNCCLAYHPVEYYMSVQYSIESIEEITSFTSLYDLTGAYLGDIPTKDTVHYYYVEAADSLVCSDDFIHSPVTGKSYSLFDVENMYQTVYFREYEYCTPEYYHVAGWQVQDLDGKWVDVVTVDEYDKDDDYIRYHFSSDTYEDSTPAALFLYLSQHPELGRFAEVSSSEFTHLTIRPVYEKNDTADLTAVNSVFVDQDTLEDVSQGKVYTDSLVWVDAVIPDGMAVKSWTVTLDGAALTSVPYSDKGTKSISYYDGSDCIAVYIEKVGKYVVTATFEEAETVEPDTYDVKFEATDGGEVYTSMYDPMLDGGAYAMAKSHFGYIFVGWYGKYAGTDYSDSDDDYEKKYGWYLTDDKEMDAYVYSNVTFTAVFEKADVSKMHAVYIDNGYLNCDGNNVYMSSIYSPGNIATCFYKDPTQPVLHKWEYTYNGETYYEHYSDEYVSFVFAHYDTEVRGVDESGISYYTLVFDGNGGDGSMDSITVCEDEVSVSLPECIYTKENYDFLGWNTDKDATTVIYDDEAGISLDSDMTLYAIWKASSHSVPLYLVCDYYGLVYYYTFATDADHLDVTYGEEVVIPATSSLFTKRIGFDVQKWVDQDGNEYAADGTAHIDYSVNYLTAELKYYSVTIHFDANVSADQLSVASMSDISITTDGHTTVSLPDDTAYFERLGYGISGWYLDSEYSSSTSSGRSSMKMYLLMEGISDGGTVTVYAKWDEVDYDVYYCNGDIQSHYSKTVSITDSTFPVATSAFFTKEGYTLTGWNTKADGTGVTYAAGTSITAQTLITDAAAVQDLGNEDIYLYVIWTEN